MTIKGYTSPIAVHPGETIKEVLDVLQVTQVDLSLRTELSEKTISLILNGKHPITLETALKLERALGISKDGLIKMQTEYDCDLLRLKESERLESETVELEKFAPCYSDLVKLGYVKSTKILSEKVDNLLRFFNINSLLSLKETLPVAFRKSEKYKVNPQSIAAWLKIGRIEADKREVKEFDIKKLNQNIGKMRNLTIESPESFSKELIELCAESGVVLVYTPALKQTCINGATSWLSPTKVLIQVSTRYHRADIFWFTFFHEIAHVLKHGKKEVFISYDSTQDQSESNQDEIEADAFAQETLIPNQREFEGLVKSLNIENEGLKIHQFAKSLNIHSGIVAGRIGKETGQWKRMEKFRQRIVLKKES